MFLTAFLNVQGNDLNTILRMNGSSIIFSTKSVPNYCFGFFLLRDSWLCGLRFFLNNDLGTAIDSFLFQLGLRVPVGLEKWIRLEGFFNIIFND